MILFHHHVYGYNCTSHSFVLQLRKNYNWMAQCKTHLSDFFGWIFSLQNCLWICSCAFQLTSKTSPCIFLPGLHFVSEKTKTKYWSVHNECNKAGRAFQPKKYVFLPHWKPNWKAHAKIQALLKEKIYPKKSRSQSCTKPFNLLKLSSVRKPGNLKNIPEHLGYHVSLCTVVNNDHLAVTLKQTEWMWKCYNTHDIYIAA